MKLFNFKLDPECYKCGNTGWIIDTIGLYVICPICKDSVTIRNIKQYVFNILLKFFRVASDSLDFLNWASEDTLREERLYKVETKGHFEVAEEPAFQSYEEVFNSGNEILKNKYAHKILSNYLYGSSENTTNIETAIKILLEELDHFSEMYDLAKRTHTNATLGKDTSDEFYNRLQEIRTEESQLNH
jgi:hypothetical protein